MSIMALAEQPDFESQLKGFISSEHMAWLGMKIEGHGVGWIEFSMPWADHITTDAGDSVHPAVIYTFMDSVCAMTPYTRIPEFWPYPTLDFRVDVVRPSIKGRTLHARGECYAVTPDYSYTRGYIHDGDPDDPVAHCSGTFMSVKRPG